MLFAPSRVPLEIEERGQLAFVCPACTAPNVVGLVALSRAEATRCVACSRTLKTSDVIRARHSPRAARPA